MDNDSPTPRLGLRELVDPSRWQSLQTHFARVLGILIRTISPSHELLVAPSWPPSVEADRAINRLKIGGQTKLMDSMESYKRNIRSKSMILLISDFLYDTEELKEIMLRYRKNYMYLIQVLDPMEKELTLKGDVILKDMESSASLRTFVSARSRMQYKKRLEDHIIEIRDLCAHFRGKFAFTTTDVPIFEAFYHILFSAGEAS